MDTQTKEPQAVTRLEALGFKKAAGILKEKSIKARKLALAYEHYRFVRQEKVDVFNNALKAKTLNGKEPYNASWQTLAFAPIGEYEGAPPAEVLEALEVAQGRKCFDSYEVAHIRDVKDPILFGRIAGCPDRFFIGQWDNDVSIQDLLKDNEG